MIVIVVVRLRNAFKQLENVQDVLLERDMMNRHRNNVLHVKREHIHQEIKVHVTTAQLDSIHHQLDHQHVLLVLLERIR